MRSIVWLFNAMQLQSISPLSSAVVTEEKQVQSCSIATQPPAGDGLCFLNVSPQSVRMQNVKIQNQQYFLYFHTPPFAPQNGYRLDCISTCKIILNNVKALALQSQFNRTFCRVSSNHFVIWYKDTTPNRVNIILCMEQTQRP